MKIDLEIKDKAVTLITPLGEDKIYVSTYVKDPLDLKKDLYNSYCTMNEKRFRYLFGKKYGTSPNPQEINDFFGKEHTLSEHTKNIMFEGI
jgi:hypothetical protein